MTQIPAVLIVEDEAISLLGIVSHLRDVGFKVYEAVNADEAIKILATHDDIRVVFTDIIMPGSMNGLRLAAAIRNRWPPVKIIVTSGRTLDDSDLMPEGVMFMAKPYRYETVTRSVTRLAAAYRQQP